MFKENLDYLENTNIIDPKVLQTIDLLLSKSKDIVFAGSIALNALGLLRRPINDIDILIRPHTSLDDYGLTEIIKKYGEILKDSIAVKDINGKEFIGIITMINGTSVDIFKPNSLHYYEVNFINRKIKIQSLSDLILSKKAWAKFATKSYKKHQDDLKEIEENLKKLHFTLKIK